MEVSAEVQTKSNMVDTSVEFQYPVQLKTLRNELLQSIAVSKVAFEPDKVGHMNPSPEFMQDLELDKENEIHVLTAKTLHAAMATMANENRLSLTMDFLCTKGLVYRGSRLDRIERDVAELKGDVNQLKGDIKAIRTDINTILDRLPLPVSTAATSFVVVGPAVSVSAAATLFAAGVPAESRLTAFVPAEAQTLISSGQADLCDVDAFDEGMPVSPEGNQPPLGSGNKKRKLGVSSSSPDKTTPVRLPSGRNLKYRTGQL